MVTSQPSNATQPDRGPDEWDVIVLGGGPAGENAAQYAIQGSERTAVIVEHELVGGECSYWACMPSKALLGPIELLATARAMPGVREALTGVPDVTAILARRDDFTSHHDDASQVRWAQDNGIDVIRGRGRLTGERTVEVRGPDGSTRTITARHAVVLATGTTATVPPIPGLAEARPWTSRDVTSLIEVPRRVAVIGGGVVACEAATWLHGLGAEVSILVRGVRVLDRMEPEAGDLVREHFTELGVTVRTETQVRAVHRVDPVDSAVGRPRGGPVTLAIAGPDGDAELVVDEVVVATGRTPATADLGLASVGLAESGYIEVDDHLQARSVAGTWLYAVGDVNGRALLTHQGKYQARICGAVIAARAAGHAPDGPQFAASADHGQVPQVTFTAPQVASVGLTEAAARSAGHRVEAISYDLAAVAGAALNRPGYRGVAKLVVDTGTKVILGATFVGFDVAELLHSATVAVVGRVPLPQLWHAVPAYPTISEVWLRLLESAPTSWRE